MSIDAIRKRWAGVGPWRSRSSWYTHRWEVVIGYDVAATDSPVLADIIASAPADIATLLAALDALTAERDDWEATAEVLGNESLAVTLIAGQHDAALARCAELEAANHALNAMRDEALARVTRLEATLKRWWCE